MPPEITIRHAESPADLEAIRTLFREYAEYLNALLSACHVSLPAYEKELAGLPGRYGLPHGQLLLATLDGEPAGCVALQRMYPHELLNNEQDACEMKRFFVRPAARGHKLGRLMVAELLRFAKAHGYDAMYLDTVPGRMPAASAIYAAFGFVPTPKYNDNKTTGATHFRLAL